MRIGFIAGEYPPMQGGVGAYTQILARALADLGHAVHVYARAGATESDARILLSLRAQGWGTRVLPDVRHWAKTQRLDVLSLQYQTAAYDMSPYIHFLPQVARVPLVATFHDLRFPYLFPKAGRLRAWTVNHLARRSAGVISTNLEDHTRLQMLNARHALIPIGSNIAATPPTESERANAQRNLVSAVGGTGRDYLIGFFGLVNATKGLHVLIESLGELRNSGIPARLVIIGGTPGSSDPTNAVYLEQIHKQINTGGLRDFVYWTGFLEEDAVRQHLIGCDVIALPFLDGASYRRGSLMAAIACGCAIITATPAQPDALFADNENMLFTSSGDSQTLTCALTRLRDDQPLAMKLRQGAAELSQHFQWPHIAEQTAAFFQSVVNGQRA